MSNTDNTKNNNSDDNNDICIIYILMYNIYVKLCQQVPI